MVQRKIRGHNRDYKEISWGKGGAGHVLLHVPPWLSHLVMAKLALTRKLPQKLKQPILSRDCVQLALQRDLPTQDLGNLRLEVANSYPRHHSHLVGIDVDIVHQALGTDADFL